MKFKHIVLLGILPGLALLAGVHIMGGDAGKVGVLFLFVLLPLAIIINLLDKYGDRAWPWLIIVGIIISILAGINR